MFRASVVKLWSDSAQTLVHTKQPLQEILNVFIIKVSVWIVKSSLFNILPVENDADLKDIADINIFAVLRASRFRIGGGSGRGVIFCTGLQYIFDWRIQNRPEWDELPILAASLFYGVLCAGSFSSF